MQISNPNILKTVTNTRNSQLQKIPSILSSLQNLFGISTTLFEKK